MKSKLFSINYKDLAKGLIVAVFSAIVAALYPMVVAGQLPSALQFRLIGFAGFTAGIGYITTNFFSNSAGQPLASEVKAKVALKAQGFMPLKSVK